LLYLLGMLMSASVPVIAVMLLLSAALPKVLSAALSVVALIAALWVASRLSLALPGIAVDKEMNFGAAWELSRNHQGLMFLIVVVFPFLLSIPIVLLNRVPEAFFL